MENSKIDFDSLFSGRSSVKHDDFDLEPSVENQFCEFGDFQLVGHGKVANDYCGKFYRSYGCFRVELHDRTTLAGQNFKGKGYVKVVRFSCDKPTCPKCYFGGWAVREGRRIKERLEVASKRFGQVEHIICSVPSKDYGLSHEALRRKADKVLKSRGVVGGVKIFHGFRYDPIKLCWFWSPHFHVLGFIRGGYSRCRNCKRKWNCLKGCGGFDDRNYHDGFLRDGWLVKIKGKRKSVYHTAWYQLNHSSIDVTKKRFHVATWFGVVSYRKMKVEKCEKQKAVCPICGHDLEEYCYLGRNLDIWAVLRSDRVSCSRRSFYADYLEDGQPAWIVVERRRWSSGS